MKRTTTIMGMVLFLTLLISVPVRAQIQLENPVVTDADDMLHVTLSLTDKNGTELDQTKLYFSVYKDNADAPVLFDKTTFAYIDSEMTEIPYGYSDSQMYDIWSSDGTTTIYHPSSWSGFKKLGAQAIYHDGDVTYTSEIVWKTVLLATGKMVAIMEIIRAIRKIPNSTIATLFPTQPARSSKPSVPLPYTIN